jgi:hypothetical protein
MKTRWLLVAASVLALVTVDSALAKPKHQNRARIGTGNTETLPSYAPAHIIQVRPGVFISNYDCITDDGYGRWRPCSDRK